MFRSSRELSFQRQCPEAKWPKKEYEGLETEQEENEEEAKEGGVDGRESFGVINTQKYFPKNNYKPR